MSNEMAQKAEFAHTEIYPADGSAVCGDYRQYIS